MRKIGNWLIEGNTGLSSKSMAAIAMGGSPAHVYAPCDPSDFRRCIDFLSECVDPSNRGSLVLQMGEFTDAWKRIGLNWFKLVALYEEEMKEDRAPKLYAYMKELKL